MQSVSSYGAQGCDYPRDEYCPKLAPNLHARLVGRATSKLLPPKPEHQLVRKEFMRASKLIDDAAAQRVDPDLVLDYICEPLPVPDQVM